MEKLYKRGRLMYIFEAGLEYLISILVADMYLASLTEALGISDSVTGVLSSVISLGCLFQLLTTFLRGGKSKPLVVVLSIVNQLLFASLYIIPLTGWDGKAKQVIFICVIIIAYFFYNIAHPKKINWLMSLIDDEKRGRFTAKKEVISLIAGVIFNFVMGELIEYYKAKGDMKTAFVICGTAIIGIMVLHTLTMLLTVEKEAPVPSENQEKKTTLGILEVIKDKNILKVTLVFCLWYMASASATPFYGAYKNGELGFSTTFGVAILGAIYALARAVFSFIWGKYADKYSFAKMLRICFLIASIGFFINIFCRPENGHVIFTIYYVCYAIAMGGINSALINLCYDYVSPEKRTNALAVSLAISGVCGFLTTLLVSPIVSYIQARGNTFLGMNVYAQQVLSAIAFIMTIITMIYVSVALVKNGQRATYIKETDPNSESTEKNENNN